MGFFNLDMDVMNVKLEGLTKLLRERIPNGDNVFHENHDDDKQNVNYYFRHSIIGFKTNDIENINMRKFYGKDLVSWIL